MIKYELANDANKNTGWKELKSVTIVRKVHNTAIADYEAFTNNVVENDMAGRL